MAGYRFWLQCSVSIVVALMFVQVGRSQTPLPPGALIGALGMALKPGAVNHPTCKVYSLAELGDDPKLCKWIAETIPEMIQPASWKQADAKLSYYAPSKILVVNNTPAVHAKVDEFLQSLKKTLPQQKASARHDAQVVPAQFALQDPSRPLVGPVQTGPGSYPVPYPPVGPKHLFHFIIRYEGEGIIDSNVAKFTKALMQEKASSSQSSYVFPPPSASVDPLLQRTNGTNAPTNVAPAPPMPPADAPPSPGVPDRFPGTPPQNIPAPLSPVRF